MVDETIESEVSGAVGTDVSGKRGGNITPQTGRSVDAEESRKELALRLQVLARDVSTLTDELGHHGIGASSARDAHGGASGVTASTQRRLELLARLLDKQTQELGRLSADDSLAPIPRNNIAFSWLPDVSVDNNSVTVGVPGVGEASIGSDGASVSVDGVGGASVSPGGRASPPS